MCEITYTNLHDPGLNRLMVYLLTSVGSEKHDDGTGIMCPSNQVWKTKLKAKIITNYGSCLFSNVSDNSAVPAHIRQATFGIEVNDANAHPFSSDNYLLLHNGTLTTKSDKEQKDLKEDSDSLTFLKYLEETKKKSPKAPFEELFKEAMSHFTGKFAFVIRDIPGKAEYIVRGKTANLYISELKIEGKKKILGYVINTNSETMKMAFHHFINIAALFYGVDYEFSEPKLLEQESIFRAMPFGINRIADAKEEITVIKGQFHHEDDYYWNMGRNRETSLVPTTKPRQFSSFNSPNNSLDKASLKLLENSKRIYEYLDDHSLSFLDLQLILVIVGGISILEMNEDDVNFFLEYMLSKISAKRKFRKTVKSILGGGSFPPHLYKDFDLEYPWMLNEDSKVLEALESLKKGDE